MLEWFSSLQAYGGAIMSWWWALVVGVAGGLFWLFQISGAKWLEKLPQWLAPVVFVSGLSLAQFLAYHELRVRNTNQLDLLFAGLPLVRVDPVIVGSGVEFTLVFKNTTTIALRYKVQDVRAVFNQQEIPNTNINLAYTGGLVAAGQEGRFKLTGTGIPTPINDGRIAYTLTYGPAGETEIFKSRRVLRVTPSVVTGQLTWDVVEQEDSRL